MYFNGLSLVRIKLDYEIVYCYCLNGMRHSLGHTEIPFLLKTFKTPLPTPYLWQLRADCRSPFPRDSKNEFK